jgi:hypothetical protein
MTFEVWYMRPSFFRDGSMGVKWLQAHKRLPTTGTLGDTHAMVKEVEADTLEGLFWQMQGENWSPNGEARALIQGLGLEHTSMSVGDVARDAKTGACWIADSFGFQLLSQATAKSVPLGRLLATPGALRALDGERIAALLARHIRGDWGVVDADDRAANDAALAQGERILSAYAIDPAKPCAGHGANCVWIITERDRSVTTVLLPEEY